MCVYSCKLRVKRGDFAGAISLSAPVEGHDKVWARRRDGGVCEFSAPARAQQAMKIP
jgi:hypothetical protein